jgi:hypothetical protein
VKAVCAKCTKCPAWIILHGSVTRHPGAGMNEVRCPVDSCATIVQAKNHETRMWEIPESWIKRGYFYEQELRAL